MPVWTIDNKKIVQILVNIEKSFDVNSLSYRGILIWPFIRMEIRKRIIFSTPYLFENNATISYPKPGDTGKDLNSGPLGRLFPLPFRKLKYILNLFTSAFNRTDALFFATWIDHREEVNNKSYSAEFDPLAEKLLKKGISFLKVEFGEETGFKVNSRYFPSIQINPNDFVNFNRHAYREFSIPHFTDFRKVVLEKTLGMANLDEGTTLGALKTLLDFSSVFSKILKFFRPKMVFLATYYSLQQMGLILAAKKLGIKTIDVQHGVQGEIHFMYSNWHSLPQDGYQLFPDYFWIWSGYFENTYRRWLPQNNPPHQPIVGGHLWLNKWVNCASFGRKNEEEEYFEGLMRKWKKVILVTMDFSDPPIPEHLFEAMKITSNKYFWLLRTHPLQRKFEPQLIDFIQSKGILNFEMRKANKFSLYSILRHVNFHVTFFSSVSFEALHFNVPTSSVHFVGLEDFREFIEEGVFQYACSSEALLHQIENAGPIKMPIKPVFEIDSNLNDNGINKLLLGAGIRGKL